MGWVAGWTGYQMGPFVAELDFDSLYLMGRDGDQKCPLIFSYFVSIIPTYIDTKKLPPTFKWVSKFDVKFGVGVKIFTFTAAR